MRTIKADDLQENMVIVNIGTVDHVTSYQETIIVYLKDQKIVDVDNNKNYVGFNWQENILIEE